MHVRGQASEPVRKKVWFSPCLGNFPRWVGTFPHRCSSRVYGREWEAGPGVWTRRACQSSPGVMRMRLSTAVMPGAWAAARSASSRSDQDSTSPVSVAVEPSIVTLM